MFLKVKAPQPQNLGQSKVEGHCNLGERIASNRFLSVT